MVSWRTYLREPWAWGEMLDEIGEADLADLKHGLLERCIWDGRLKWHLGGGDPTFSPNTAVESKVTAPQ